MLDMSDQGTRVKDTLKKYGLTQAKAAQLLGIDVRTMRRYMTGESIIHPCCEKLLNYIGRTHLYNSARDRSSK
jgi:transcriptional regulator with XRE-family HTH domain